MSLENSLQEKREIFLSLLEKIESKVKEYYALGSGKAFKKILFSKEKALIKIGGIIIKKLFNFNLVWRAKTFWGREIFVYPFDGDSSYLLFFGSLGEMEISRFLIKTLKRDDVFYDIGANYGFYTLLAQEFIDPKSGEVHSFEPLPEIFNLLTKSAKGNKFNNTFLNNFAVADKSDMVEMYSHVEKRHSGGSSIIKNKEGKATIIKVKAITLDDYIKDHKAPTIIKIDIEGAEYLALKGGLELLKKASPVIIMETLGDDILPDASLRLKAVNLLKELNYRPYSLLPNGEIKEVSYDVFNSMKGVYNYVFLK